MSVIRLREFPLGEQELAAKRRYLVLLRELDTRMHGQMLDLEDELGNAVCGTCGYAHRQPCSTDALLERRA